MSRPNAGTGSDVVIPTAGETFVAEDGTVSVVLADNLDDHYEPTRDELQEFASWMGMELPGDEEFLWIAREGLKAPLPKDWRPCRTNEDEIYYFNFRTGESTWNHPMDDHFRRKFAREKERKRGGGGATASAPAAMAQKAPLAKVTPKAFADAAVLKAQSTAAAPGERRIVSEAEQGLELRIRQEREAQFRAETDKAEQLLQERLEAIRRVSAAETARLREELAASRQSDEARNAARAALDAKWRDLLDAARHDEADLRRALARLPAEHARRVAAAAKAERPRAASPTRAERGGGNADAAERARAAARAKCEEIRGAAAAEAKRVRAAAAKRGDEAARERRARHAEDLAAIKAERSPSGENSARDKVTAARAAAEAEEAAVRADGEERLRTLRLEIQRAKDQKKSVPVSTSAKDTHGNGDKKSVPGDAAAKDIRGGAEAAIRAREAAHEETEAALRCALAESTALSEESREAQVTAAVAAELAAFVREQEVRRRFQRGDAEEIMRAAEDDAVLQARRAVAAEWAISERQLRQRYRDERVALTAEVEEEMAAYDTQQRQAIDADIATQLRAVQQEQQLREKRQSEKKKKKKKNKAEAKRAKREKCVEPQEGVARAELDGRLCAIEKTFAAREAALLAELREASRPIPIPTPTPVAEPAGSTRPPTAAQASSSFTSEALRFLSETQRESGLRSELVHAAREEWQADMRHSTAAAAVEMPPAVAPPPAAPRAAGVAGAKDPAEAQLFRLIGVVNERLEKLAVTVTSMRCESPSRRTESPRTPRGLVRKWSQILFDLAPSPMGRSELTALIRRELIPAE